MSTKLTIALPKGRIFDAMLPILGRAGLVSRANAARGLGRRIKFASLDPEVEFILVRAADVLVYVSYGAAQLGVIGRDMLLEHAPADIVHGETLGIARCKLVVGALKKMDYARAVRSGRQLTVATKYPNLAGSYMAAQGVQAEIVKLYGSMELAPAVDLSDVIVDLVDTGETMRANGLRAVATIMPIATQLIYNQPATWRRGGKLKRLTQRLLQAL